MAMQLPSPTVLGMALPDGSTAGHTPKSQFPSPAEGHCATALLPTQGGAALAFVHSLFTPGGSPLPHLIPESSRDQTGLVPGSRGPLNP